MGEAANRARRHAQEWERVQQEDRANANMLRWATLTVGGMLWTCTLGTYLIASIASWFLVPGILPVAWVAAGLFGLLTTSYLFDRGQLDHLGHVERLLGLMTACWIAAPLIFLTVVKGAADFSWRVAVLAPVCLSPFIYAWHILLQRDRDRHVVAGIWVGIHLLFLWGAAHLLE